MGLSLVKLAQTPFVRSEVTQHNGIGWSALNGPLEIRVGLGKFLFHAEDASQAGQVRGVVRRKFDGPPQLGFGLSQITGTGAFDALFSVLPGRSQGVSNAKRAASARNGADECRENTAIHG